jgi:hypothetical protein
MLTTQGGLYGLHMIKPVHVVPIDGSGKRWETVVYYH